MKYFYLSSVNKELVDHQIIIKYHSKRMYTFDIGSNDGIFLKPLIEKGVTAIGIDPSKNVGKIANDNNLETVTGFFDEKNTNFILNKYGKSDYIVASIFTHVENSHEFIENICKLLKTDSIYIRNRICKKYYRKCRI